MKLNGVRIVILLLAIVIAIFHALYVRAIFFSLRIGGYFLLAAVLFFIGGLAASLGSGRLLRMSNAGLVILSIIDNSLIVYTRELPSIFFGGRILPWSAGWMPPGTVQFFIAQSMMIFVSGYALLRARES